MYFKKIYKTNISYNRAVPLILLTLIMFACSLSNKEKFATSPVNIQTERYLQDLTFIAKLPRTPGTPHHKAVQTMCAKKFNDLGFQVELHDYGTGINVIGIYPGKQKPDEKIIVSAHYDTVPYCNGADDNASGIAGVFETARLLVSKKHNRTLVVACWDEEEKKTTGSKVYVVREKSNKTAIKMSYVYEMIGYKSDQSNSQQIPEGFEKLYPQQVKQIQNDQNRGDFIALIYDEQASEFLLDIATHAKNNKLPVMQFEVSSKMKTSPLISDLRRSDHSAFWDADYPAIMITDTANFRNQNYHCVNGADDIENLDIDFAVKIVNTLSVVIENNLK